MASPSATRALAFAALLAFAVGAVFPAAIRALRIVVHNRSYSAFVISMRVGEREQPLGQAPPDFTNTLFVPEPLPQQPVRFVARLPGDDDIAYTSSAVRLAPGATLQWHLPANTLSGIDR